MGKFKYLLLVISLIIVYFYGCDDSGNVTVINPKGQITFSQNNLKTLASGNFELWLALDTNSVRTWYSLGRFNINSSGAMVDLSGNLMQFKYNGDTNRLGLSTVALVTFETDSDPNPSIYRIMSGSLTITSDTISGNILMSGVDALGGLGATYLSSPHYIGDYVLKSPTTNPTECYKGLWFCDDSGASHFISGLDLPASNPGWRYEGWVVDNTLNTFYSTGKFWNFSLADENGPGPCPGTNPPFNKPGQEFVTGCPAGTNLNNGNYGVFITLQPSVLSGTPFFIRLFQRDVIQTSLSCGERDVFFRSLGYESLLPAAYIKIAN